MKLVIAEKPSVGNSIARMIGADRQRGDGFTSGNGYIVSWCFGHLVALSSPEEYDKRYAKPWKLSNLPIIPEEFRWTVEKVPLGLFRRTSQPRARLGGKAARTSWRQSRQDAHLLG